MEVPWTLSNPPHPHPHHPSPQPPPPKKQNKKKPGCGGGVRGAGDEWWGGWGGGDFVNKLLRTTPNIMGKHVVVDVHVHVHVGLCTRRFVHNPMGLSQRHHFKGLTLLDLTPRTQSDYTVLFGKDILGRHFWSKTFLGRLFFKLSLKQTNLLPQRQQAATRRGWIHWLKITGSFM